MKMKRSAASLKPQFRVVTQFTMLLGIWSRKIPNLPRLGIDQAGDLGLSPGA